MKRFIELLLVSTLLVSSGCLARGNVTFIVEDPVPDAWTPASLALAALAAGGGDPDNAWILGYGATFDEGGHLRVLDLKLQTIRPDGTRLFLDYLLAQPFDGDSGTVTIKGFAHPERATGQRPDPSREWLLEPPWTQLLDRYTFAQLDAAPLAELGGATVVREFRLMPECQPRWTGTGTWRAANATADGVADPESGFELPCFARPQLPPAMLLNHHVPCIPSAACPDGSTHQSLVRFET